VSASLLSLLRSTAGATAVRERTGTAVEVAGVAALAVVEPDSADAVAEVLALCTGEGVPVEAAGACTWLRHGPAPAAPPVVVSTARLRRVTEYEPADLVIGVQAGATLEDVEGELRQHGQTLPLDPPCAPGGTLGAVLSLGSAGPLRAAHRTPRDLALGVEIVTGDGRLLRFGGRVVKNVAGYDGVRLVAGSAGSLGVVTGMFMLVRSAPAEDETLQVVAGGFDEAAALALEVWRTVPCDALEVLPGGEAGWTVAVRLRGSAAAVHDAADRFRALSGTAVPRPAPSGYWAEAGRAEAEASLHLVAAAPPAALAAVLAAAGRFVDGVENTRSAADSTHPGAWRIAAHAADGIVRLWQPRAAPVPQPDRLAQGLSGLHAELAECSGTCRYTVLPAALQPLIGGSPGGPAAGAGPGAAAHAAAGAQPVPGATGADVAGAGEAGASALSGAALVARRLRAAFDPAGIMTQRRGGVWQ
jgi:glycolate oxidase FAD binding subunit